MPIFRHFDIGDGVHSSSDGQKFETAIPTVNARHSAKYFGLKKGVVAYTLLASHVPLSARIIGANEHESHYVFDVLFNNLTHIQPETHSTDTHGTNQVNFALLHLFGYRFAPRYRNFRRKVQSALYGFQHPGEVDGPLKPVRRIREQLIVSEWPNIEWILLSLALKTTTQTVIVSKLSTYRCQNRTKQALWEFDHIIRSLYLLDYADSPALRRNVHRALNRGEAYHRLRPPSPTPTAGACEFAPSTSRSGGTSARRSSLTRWSTTTASCSRKCCKHCSIREIWSPSTP